MKKWLRSRLRRFVRRHREKRDSRLVPGHEIAEDIPIDSLIYPLRYDVIVRAEFMAYYQQARELFTRDFDEFLAHPVARAYFAAWFSDASRSRPQLGLDRAAMQREFRVRVRRAIALFESLEFEGFNDRHPIELRSATRIRHEHDKDVQRRFFAGDGCHRLAYLALQGQANLAPSQYCVRVFEEFCPRDNTYLLLGKVIRAEDDYCRAISRFYCSGKVYSESQTMLEHVRQNSPNQVEEIASVVRVDLGRLSEVRGGSESVLQHNAGSTRVPKV